MRFPDSSPPKPNESRVVDVRAEEGLIRFQCIFSGTKKLTVNVQYVNDEYLSLNKTQRTSEKTVLAGDLRFNFSWTRGKDGTGNLKLTSWNARPIAPIVTDLREKRLKKEPIEFRLVTQQEEKGTANVWHRNGFRFQVPLLERRESCVHTVRNARRESAYSNGGILTQTNNRTNATPVRPAGGG